MIGMYIIGYTRYNNIYKIPLNSGPKAHKHAFTIHKVVWRGTF